MTNAQRTAALQFIVVIAELIRELGSIPSGYLYVRIQALPGMGSMTLTQYRQLLDTLKDAKLITETSHLLEWVGPPKVEVDVKEAPTGEGRY